jgi:hypothetical protein
MSFGRNPHVTKAETAEQKAADASDEGTRRRAHLDAAHLWERAAEREKPGKQRDAHLARAERNRVQADGRDPDAEDETPSPRSTAGGPAESSAAPRDPKRFN